jgi:uncharacterized protein (TIGR00730 family)
MNNNHDTPHNGHNSLVPLTRHEIVTEVRRHIKAIETEFDQVFTFINKYPKSVTFFGSARFSENSEHYKAAKNLASELSKRGYSILTGGGGGIMEGANRGAYEAGGPSLGINIKLPSEQIPNRYLNAEFECSFFFSRKTALAFAAEAYIFFPGGFGTLDEFFEIVTLIQTGKIPAIPIIMFGKDYWEPLRQFIYEQMYVAHNAIKKEDLDLYVISDDPKETIARIEKETLAKEKRLEQA